MKKHNKTYRKKLTKRQREERRYRIVFAAVLIAVVIIGHNSVKEPYKAELEPKKAALTHRLPVNADKKHLTIQDKIAIAATKANIDVNTALAIAHCESRFNPKARNQQGSSATGVYQFIARTWFDYCEGDVKDADDNIACFMKLYPIHKSWWACDSLIAKR